MHSKTLRRLAAATAAAATAVLLGGCAVNNGGPAGQDVGSYDPDEEVTITFAWWGSEARAQITQGAIDAFEEEYPNITVETQTSDFGSYWDMLATQVAAGDAPDLITMGGSYPSEYASRGALLDLGTVSDYIDTSKLAEGSLDTGKHDGVQYTVPAGINALATFLNPAVFEGAGVELPDTETWTWDDYATAATQISQNSPDGTYGAVPFANTSGLDVWIRQHGEASYSEDGESVAASEDTIAGWFQLWLDAQRSGATPGASIFVEDSTAVQEQSLFGTQRAAMMFGWSNYKFDTISEDIVVANLPGESTEPGNRIGASMEYGISSASEHPEAAALLLDFLVNNTATVDAIGNDRGMPANEDLRAHLRENLTPAQQKEVDLLDLVTASGSGAKTPAPQGASSTSDILTRLMQDVLFERTTPEDAAAVYISEVDAALK